MIESSLLNDLFPFYVELEADLRVVSIGRSMHKILPNLNTNNSILEKVTFKNPTPLDSFAQLKASQDCQVQLFFGHDRVYLAGQLKYCSNRERMYFLGSPIITDTAFLDEFGLHVNDFAIHDVNVSHMVLQQLHHLQLEELRETTNSLQRSLMEKERMKQMEKMLLQDLHAACDFYLRFDAEGLIIMARSSRPELSPLPTEKLIGMNIFKLDERVKAIVAEVDNQDLSSSIFCYEYTVESRGTLYHMSAQIARTEDLNYVIVARDITEQAKVKMELDYQANHDELTGLPNRRAFHRRIRNLVSADYRATQSSAVLMVDLDDFKQANDSFGHSAGDTILKLSSERLLTIIRSSDMVARLGGDEFAIFLDEAGTKEQVEVLAQRILNEIEKPISLEHGCVTIGATIGMVMVQDNDNIDSLMRTADLALYHAKDFGKRRYSWYTPQMKTDYRNRIKLLEDMRVALDQGDFHMNYQPIINLETYQIGGFEALARWKHPELNWIRPDIFVGLAEEFDLIGELSAVLFNTLCTDIATFKNDYKVNDDFKFNFNISARELRHEGLAKKMQETIAKHALSPHCITIELTESALVDRFETAKKELELLQSFGMSIALDDFGSGYSSLSYLANLPVDVVKIDRSFVQAMTDSNNDVSEVLVGAIVGLQPALGIKVVAEGIETQKQLELLKKMGCAFGQGFLLAQPCAVSEAVQYLQGNLKNIVRLAI